MQYYKASNAEYDGEIIRMSMDGTLSRYSFGEEKWVPCCDVECGGKAVTEADVQSWQKGQRARYEVLLRLAEQVAEERHRGQVDKGGTPYFEHPKAVAASLNNMEHKIVAYLHDICEDTPTSFADLSEMGFPPRIVKAVALVTKTAGVSYADYLEQIRQNECAKAVKMADLRHNMLLSRIPHPTEKDYVRLAKYQKSLDFLANLQAENPFREENAGQSGA